MVCGGRTFYWPLAAAVAVGAACLAALPAWAVPRKQATVEEFLAVRPVNPSDNPDRPPPLAHANDEWVNMLVRSRQLLEQKDYHQAIQILQALIDRGDTGFVPARDGRRWASLWTIANDLIGGADEAGIRLYRRLYEAQAQQLYEQAVAAGDTRGLRRVAYLYLHTRHGSKALDTLGMLQFDRGRYLEAIDAWQNCLDVLEEGPAAALLLARLAVANQLAGRVEQARKLAQTLAEKYPQAEAPLSGRVQKIAQFAQSALSLPAPPAAAIPQQAGWPGLGAMPDGVGLMVESQVVLVPRWRKPEMPTVSGEDVGDKLIALRSARQAIPGNRAMSIKAVKGHVQMEPPRNTQVYDQNGQIRAGASYLPPMIQPVVVGETVIVREDEAVNAYNIITGEKVWAGQGRLEKEREGPVQYYGYWSAPSDSGQYTLTVGAGTVYALTNYVVNQPGRFHMGMPGQPRRSLDSSCLVAFSISDEGKVRWSVGNGSGEQDVIRNGKFLSAPTYCGDLLYVMVLYQESYHVVCLKSGTGEFVWSSLMAQVPAQSGFVRMGDTFCRGSCPAVSEGIVVAVTNSGVVAGFEADTGRPLWAHQYPSTVNRMGPNYGMVAAPRRTGSNNPPNPIILSRGRAYCLPSDSDKLLALDCRTGSLAWEASRENQKDLSFIDHDRLLLSGDGLVVIGTERGETLKNFPGEKVAGILGRPAVSPRYVLASGEARLYRLHLIGPDYLLESMDLQSPQGLLGNLVSMDGKLIAANTAGLCAYFDYEYIRKVLSERLANAPDSELRQLLMQRGTLAFSAERFQEALADLLRCEDLSRQAGDNETTQRVLPHLYRTYIALGNRAEKNEQMREMFEKAQAYAVSPSDKAHLKIRLAKYFEKAGQLEKAVEVAQELAAEGEDLKVADVAIGPEGNDLARLGPDDEKVSAGEWGQTFVRRLIEIHGQKVYAIEDAKAEDALRKARDGADPQALERLAQRWPNSKWTDDAQFYAAELLYLEGTKAAGVQAETIFTRTRRLLWAVSNIQASELRVSAVVGLAAICSRSGWQLVASQTLDQVRSLPGDTPVKFADIQGRLADLIKKIEAGKITSPPAPGGAKVLHIQAILPELDRVYALAGEQVILLRDQDGQPVRVGQKLVALNGKRAILLDTASQTAPDENGWSALVSLEGEPNVWMMAGANLVGTLSGDGKSVLVAYRTSLRRFDLATAKLTLDVKLGDLGAPSPAQMAIDPRVLVVVDSSGKIICVNLADGSRRWEANMGAGRGASSPPDITKDHVLIRDRTCRQLLLLDLPSGKVVEKFEAKSFAEGCVTPEGFLVTLLDGELSVREAAKPGKQVWFRRYGEQSGAGLLCVTGEYIVVSPSAGNEVHVLPMTGSGVSAAEFKLDAAGGEKAIPMEACFDGDSLYVLSTAGLPGNTAPATVRRSIASNRWGACRHLAVHRLGLKKDKPAWAYALDATGRYLPRPAMPAVGQKHLVAIVRETQQQAMAKAVILDKDTGKAVQTIDLTGQDPKVKAEVRTRKLAMVGQAVLTDGFLTVETGDGVAVYGSK